MILRLRVAVLTSAPARAAALAALVRQAGHDPAPAGADADVALADAGAAPVQGSAIPAVALGDAAGAAWAGVLPRDPLPRQLDAALRAAAAGLKVRPRPSPGFAPAEQAGSPLTAREREILGAIGLGLSNKEVARRLGISVHTVKFHLEAAFRKLGAASRAEAVAKLMRQGMMEV